MKSADKYHELKMEIARAAAAEQRPSLEGFRRAFTEEFGHPPPVELIKYFNAQKAALDHGIWDEDSCTESEIEWCMESPDPLEDSPEAEAGWSAPSSGSGAGKRNQGPGLALPADLSEHAVLEALLRTLHTEAVAITDARGIVVYLNPAAEALLGEPLQQVKGCRFLGDFFCPLKTGARSKKGKPGRVSDKMSGDPLAALCGLLTTGSPRGQRLIRAHQKELEVRVGLAPLTASDGQLKGYLCSFARQPAENA